MKFDETVHLSIRDNDKVLYVDCVESKKRLRTYSVIGIKAPLYCTGVGKAILAFLHDNEIERIIGKKNLKNYTKSTITDKIKLLQELRKIREKGFAIDDMEHEEFLRCVGAPIRNYRGEVFASISISGPSHRIARKLIPEIAKAVKFATDDISRKLGYVSARLAVSG